MTVNSLLSFGVPGLQGDRHLPLQPIMSNKFRLVFRHFGDTIPVVLTRQVRTVSVPAFIFAAGSVSSGYINIKFLDDITSSALRPILAQLARQRDAGPEENARFEMQIELLSSGTTGPEVIRTYVLQGCMIENFLSDKLDYAETTGLEFNIFVSHKVSEIFDGESHKIW